MHILNLIASSAATGSQTTPALPGSIVAWIVCNARKRNPIGGWLLFFYWQLYGGLLMAAVFFTINIQSYVPENFDSHTRFAMFLLSAVPGLLLLSIQAVVATIALGVQTRDMLALLRGVLVAETIAACVALVIDITYFPDNAVFSILTLIQSSLWLAYMLKSARVRHVFSQGDWEVAVSTIYPLKGIKLKTST